MNKILITGASGYLGSTFINEFKEKYDFVSFSLQRNSIKSIDFHDVDVVLHCAALVHQKVEHNYEQYYEINVDYPVRLAKLAKQNGAKQFVFISTIAVYDEDKERLDEHTTCDPITFYGKSKLEAEKKLQALEDENFIVSIIRPPMVYGKNAPGNIRSLINLVSKIPILPFGEINNKRSFIYIGNLCHFIDEIITQAKGGVFLASDDKPLSTSKLIELIANGLGRKTYLIRVSFFESFLKLVKPSFHKRLYGSLEVDNFITKEKLDLKNPYSVEEGIALMLNVELWT